MSKTTHYFKHKAVNGSIEVEYDRDVTEVTDLQPSDVQSQEQGAKAQ